MSNSVRFCDIFTKNVTTHDDLVLMEYLLKSNPEEFKNFPDAFKTKEISDLAYRFDKKNIKYMKDEHITEEMLLNIINYNNDIIQYLPESKMEFVRLHILCNYKDLPHTVFLNIDTTRSDIVLYCIDQLDNSELNYRSSDRNYNGYVRVITNYFYRNVKVDDSIKERLTKFLCDKIKFFDVFEDYITYSIKHVDIFKYYISHGNMAFVLDKLRYNLGDLSRDEICELILVDEGMWHILYSGSYYFSSYVNMSNLLYLYNNVKKVDVSDSIYFAIMERMCLISKIKFFMNVNFKTKFLIKEMQ